MWKQKYIHQFYVFNKSCARVLSASWCNSLMVSQTVRESLAVVVCRNCCQWVNRSCWAARGTSSNRVTFFHWIGDLGNVWCALHSLWCCPLPPYQCVLRRKYSVWRCFAFVEVHRFYGNGFGVPNIVAICVECIFPKWNVSIGSRARTSHNIHEQKNDSMVTFYANAFSYALVSLGDA